MSPTESGASEAPGITVTASVAELAFASTWSRDEAEKAQAQFQKTDSAMERIFVLWWQEKTLIPLPKEAIVAPRYVLLHHEIMDRFRHHLGKPVGQQGRVLPTAPLLPCRRCGRVFTSEPRRGQYARLCGDSGCSKVYPPRTHHTTREARQHITGAVGFRTDGFHEAGPSGPGIWWSVLCQHPECVTIFQATHDRNVYCSAHNRTSAMRARKRTASPKRERFIFWAPEETRVSYATSAGESRQCVVDSAGYRAQDDVEFNSLAYQAAAGLLRVASVEASE